MVVPLRRWNRVARKALGFITLTVLDSPYRRRYLAAVEFARRLAALHRDRYIAVVVPDVVERRWYHALTQTHRGAVLSTLLLLYGGPRVVLVRAPWHLGD